MRKECPNDMPQPQAVSMALMWSIALALTISHTAPLLSCHEKSGSSGPAGTTVARLLLRAESRDWTGYPEYG